jgi:hypothetical protein
VRTLFDAAQKAGGFLDVFWITMDHIFDWYPVSGFVKPGLPVKPESFYRFWMNEFY